MEKRQDINKLIEYAVTVWRNEGRDANDANSDFFNLQNDPVTRLLMGAVAYQTDSISEDISSFKNDIVEELVDLCAPEYLLQPVPAVGMLQTGKTHKVGQTDEEATRLDENMVFSISTTPGNKFSFIPILSINMFDLKVHSVAPSGRNRWHIELEEIEPVIDLFGLAFYLPKVSCERVLLHVGASTIDICNISDFERLPFIASFMDTSRPNKNAMQFATLHNIYDRLCLCSNNYCIVDKHIPSESIPRQNGCIQFDVEFVGGTDLERIAPEDILLNCVPVCNVEIHKDSLTQERPLQNVSLRGSEEFLTLSSHTQPEGLVDSVSVRQVGTSRMTPAVWLQRLQRLLDYYDSEYCLLRNTFDPKFDNILQQFILALRDAVKRGVDVDDRIYLVLRDRMIPSLGVTWLSSFGAKANDIAPGAKVEVNTAQLDAEQTGLVSYTMGGCNAVTNSETRHEALRYQVQLRDRIVSKSDILFFCRYKLSDLFSVKAEGIKDIRISNRVQNSPEGFLEKILMVEILLQPDVTIDGQAALALERMVRSRNAGVTPIRIHIQTEE
ncbi:MAG: hypothetical protein J6X88_09030 [Bacteroidales bacterium]|nr:hypothetical protein [Bacteroidales bacterium]